MSVVVVSNRVARAKPDEPWRAVWLRLFCRWSGIPARSGSDRADRAAATPRRRAVRSRASRPLAPARWRRSICRPSIIAAFTRVSPTGIVAGIALARRPYSCQRRRLRLLSRGRMRFMAKALLRFNTPETLFGSQDYHFLTLGADLRRLGIERPLGFFLHRRGQTAAPSPPCRITPKSCRRCSLTTSSVFRPWRIGKFPKTYLQTNSASTSSMALSLGLGIEQTN